MATVIGQVEAFQVGEDDWEQYTERLEQYFVANAIETAERKLAVFLTVVGAKAYSLLSDLLAPAKPASKSYAELKAVMKAVMKAHLKPKPVIIAERFQFHQRSQKDGEEVASYMAALRRLADKCEYGNHLEEALRDRFVCGLRDAAIQLKLLSKDGLTLKIAYETAYGMEAAELRAGQLQAQKAATGVGTTNVNVVRNKGPTDTGEKTGPTSCYRCGKTNHKQESCYYRKQRCRACGSLGHIARMCKNKRRGSQQGSQQANFVEPDGTRDQEELDMTGNSDDLPLLNIQAIQPWGSKGGITLDLLVDTKPLQMELDTGALVSIISEAVWKTVLKSAALTPSEIILRTYTGQRLRVLSQRVVQVEYGKQKQQLPLIVVSGNGPSLFGRNWLKGIELDWGSIKNVKTPLEGVLEEYE